MNQHAPLKVKILRENDSPFVDKNLGEKFTKEEPKTAKILPNKMQPYIRNKEINVCPCVEDVS